MSGPRMSIPRRVLYACANSWKGLAAAWHHEAAFREECLLGLILLPVAIWLARTPAELALLVFSLLLVLAAELGNSAIESVVDRIGRDHHELSGRAKDMGSAMVLVTMLNVIVVWSLVAVDRLGWL